MGDDRSIPVVIKIVAFETVAVGRTIVGRFVSEIELDRVKTNNDQAGTALVTGYIISLFALSVNKNFFAAFGANRCWHFYRSPKTY